jgi:hypothetical protein
LYGKSWEHAFPPLQLRNDRGNSAVLNYELRVSRVALIETHATAGLKHLLSGRFACPRNLASVHRLKNNLSDFSPLLQKSLTSDQV